MVATLLRVTSDSDLQKLGRYIKRLRQDRDLSQEALASLASINRNHVGAIEQGKTVASVAMIFKLAEALEVKPSALFAPFD